MSILRKETDLITFYDVVKFCEEDKAENALLDYKQDFPKDLEKTIAAMANTYGGLIIIGVADEGDKPKPPFEGITFKDSLRQRVTDISVQNISPPVVCDIGVPEKDGKCFIVIRIPQSISTPHAIDRNAPHIYVRTGQKSKPENLAESDRIKWLFSHREKSFELAKSLKLVFRKLKISRFLCDGNRKFSSFSIAA